MRKGFDMLKSAKMISIVSTMLLALGLLSACQTTPTIGTASKTVCAIWTPVTYSASQDSQATIDGIRELNARRDAYCK